MALPLDTPWRSLVSVGVTFRTAPAPLRERLEQAAAEERPLYEALQARGLAGCVLLATCDRVEVLALAGDPGLAAGRALLVLAEQAGVAPERLEQLAVRHEGPAAVRHLFAIAAGLDSMILGEPQVLGQVKEAFARARALGAAGAGLEPLFAAAFQAAKRVRSETALGQHPVSLAAAAIRVARTLHGELAPLGLVLLGLGELGEMLAQDFRDAGLGRAVVLHERAERAEAAAARLGGRARGWDELAPALADADLLIAGQGSGRILLDPPLLQRALKARRQRPILLFDLALPSDVEQGVDRLDAVFRYTLADLERLADAGKASREGAALEAWRVLGEELAQFQRAQAERGATPEIVALRRHGEALRRALLAEGRLDAETATALLLKRMLHAPSEALRLAAAEDPAAQAELAAALRRLFALPGEGEGRP